MPTQATHRGRYVSELTDEVVTLDAIRAEYPHMLIPDGAELDDIGYGRLFETDPPAPVRGVHVREGAPLETEGGYVSTWLTVPFTPDELAALDALENPPPVVPQEVSMRAARRALHAAGLYGDVAPAIAALPEPQRTQAQIDWEFAQTVRRDWDFVQMLAPVLGLDDAALDALFVAAGEMDNRAVGPQPGE